MIRIVTMHFRVETCDTFQELFRKSQPLIRAFPGCSHVELLQDISDRCRFFTYSHWENEDALNSYRASELFKTTWASAKALFDEKPAAWSVEQASV